MKYPTSIQKLIDMFTKLPTVGPKTAERYVFYLLRQTGEDLQKFAQALAELKEGVTVCLSCQAISEASPCLICADSKRDSSLLCLVADTKDMMAIEATSKYPGKYFILGGTINVIEETKAADLNLKQLLEKIKTVDIKEAIIALNPNLEGETTALYLTKLLKPYKIKVSRLARGLPSGANLEYADEITIANALKYRNIL